MKKIIVLSMEGCPYCQEFKDLLNDGNIEHTVVDIENFSTEYDMFKKITSSDYLPGFMILDEENHTLECYAADQDFFTIDQAFQLCKTTQEEE